MNQQGRPQTGDVISSNIYLVRKGCLHAAEFACYTMPGLAALGRGQRMITGNTAAKRLRNQFPNYLFTFMPTAGAIAAMRLPKRPDFPPKIFVRGSFLSGFGSEKGVLLRKVDWQHFDPDPLNLTLKADGDVDGEIDQFVDLHLYSDPDIDPYLTLPSSSTGHYADVFLRCLRADRTGPSSHIQAKLFQEHLYKVMRKRDVGVEKKSTVHGCELVTKFSVTGIDFNGLPAVVIDYTCTASIPLTKIVKLFPKEDLVRAMVRTASGPQGEIVEVQPLTEEKREELLSLSKVKANQDKIREASLDERVYTLKGDDGKPFEWLGSSLSIESHSRSTPISQLLVKLDPEKNKVARVKPVERRQKIEEFAQNFTNLSKSSAPLLVGNPVSSDTVLREGNTLGGAPMFGKLDLSKYTKEFGGGTKLPLNLRPSEIHQVLKSSGFYKVRTDPVTLGVLYVAERQQELEEMKSDSKPLLDDVQGILQEHGVLTEEILYADVAARTMEEIAAAQRELAAEGAGFVLVIAAFDKTTAEGQELWTSTKRGASVVRPDKSAFGLPTSVVFKATLSKEPFKVKNCSANVFLGIAAKLGHLLWKVDGPGLSAVDFFIGCDVSKGPIPAGTDDRSASVFILTTQEEPMTCVHTASKGETIPQHLLEKVVLESGIRQQKGLLMRHGPFRGNEINQMAELLKKLDSRATYTEIVERIPFRLFHNREEHVEVDTYLTLGPNSAILVGSEPFAGTSQPLRVEMKRNDSNLTMVLNLELVAVSRRFSCGSTQTSKLPVLIHTADKVAGDVRAVGKQAENLHSRSFS